MDELSLQEIQQGSFKVLLKFKELCEQNGWRYYLAYGTLIGAIRHKGFIPWDDDIDIWMPRPDYEKFILFCLNNESALLPFKLKHYKSCKEYIYPIARLVDSRYKIEYRDAKEYGLGLFIDIYPLDGYTNKKQTRKCWDYIRKISLIGKTKFTPSKNIFKSIIKWIYFVCYGRNGKHLYNLIKKLDEYAQKFPYEEYPKFACMVLESKQIFEKEDILSDIDVEFNGTLFNAPAGYDNILRYLYGDYMELPPEDDRVAHHFYNAYVIE